MRQKKRYSPLCRLCQGFLALLLGVLLYWHSNGMLEVEQVELTLPQLPKAFDGLTVAHVSDLHGRESRQIFQALGEQSPSLIVVTGDLLDVHTENPLDYAARMGRAMVAIAPTYYVTGNHEWAGRQAEEICAALEASGVSCLRNEALALERNGQTLVLAGVDDPNSYADRESPHVLAQTVYETYGEAICWLLLAHRNDRFATEYHMLGADLTLSGHGHGGIIRLPFTDGLVGTDLQLFPDYTSGLYTVKDRLLFVSRGMGNSGMTRRLFNPFHLPILTLRCP